MRQVAISRLASLCFVFCLGALHAQTTWVVSNLTDLRTCIGPQGNPAPNQPPVDICQLAPGAYNVGASPDLPSPLSIGRSNFTITGTMSAGPADTVLVRGISTLSSILNVDTSHGVTYTGVTISYLTFDGNRYGFGTQGSGISCLTNQLQKIDLDLGAGGNFTAQWLDFVNSPDTALHLSGSSAVAGQLSTVSYSNFGVGICPNGSGYCTGIGPTGQRGAEDGPQSATRFTAVYLSGGDEQNDYRGPGAYYNNIQYAGTAGITFDGYGQIGYGNWLVNNRYEMPDGSGGGQLTLWPGQWGTASKASIAGNVINGNNWNGGQSTETLCPVTGPLQSNGGIEANGKGHRFYNNELYANTGGGMVVNLGNPTGQILVSSSNPWYSGDAPRYIEGNGYGGITFYGTAQGWSAIDGVSLDDVLIANNAKYGVYFDNVQNNGSYLGFVQNGSCMWGNQEGGNEADVSWPNGPNIVPPQQQVPAPSTPTYLYPSSTGTYQGGLCPSPPAGLATPAPSGLPPSQWKW